MAFKHNYINTGGSKPLASQIEPLELVPNYADGTLWTKNLGGVVMGVGERVYGDWVFPNLTSPYNDSSVIIPEAERIKYRLIDFHTILVTGSFIFTGFSFNNWHTVFSLPANIRGNIQGNCLGIGKIFDFHTSAVKSVIDVAGNVRVWVNSSNLNSNQVQRIFVQITGRRV